MVDLEHRTIFLCASQSLPIQWHHWISPHVVYYLHLRISRRWQQILRHPWSTQEIQLMFYNKKTKMSCLGMFRSSCRGIGEESLIWKSKWKNWRDCQFVRNRLWWHFRGISFQLLLLCLAMPNNAESDYLRRLLAVVDMRSELANIRGSSVSRLFDVLCRIHWLIEFSSDRN